MLKIAFRDDRAAGFLCCVCDRGRLATWAIVALLFVPAAVSAQAVAAKELARRELPAVVTILTFDANGRGLSQGSGFVVAPDGVIVTNHHVIDEADAAVITMQSGEEYRVQGVLDVDLEKDFALLKVRAVDLPTLRLGNSDGLQPGELVFALGAPKGFSGSITVGNFSQERRDLGTQSLTYRMLQHSAAISGGSSGGPLILESGEVIGVNTSARTDANSVYFALPINYVRAALNDRSAQPVPLARFSADVKADREEAQRRRLGEIIRTRFVPYRDPQNLFSMMIPRAWQVQRNAWTDNEGIGHVTVMAHSPTARLADINGWLSDGIRIQFAFPRLGTRWLQSATQGWIALQQRQMLGSYSNSEIVLKDVVTVDGHAVDRLAAVGTSPKLSEPEIAVVYNYLDPSRRVSLELATPASDKDTHALVRAVLESTFTTTGIQ